MIVDGDGNAHGFHLRSVPPRSSCNLDWTTSDGWRREFEPRLGRIRNQGGRRALTYLSHVLAATNLAYGAALSGASGGAFSGSRVGRGAGIGGVLSRTGTTAYGWRRVIIKSRIVKLAGGELDGVVAHLRYLQRDGTTREG